MKLNLTKVAVIVGVTLSQYAVGASMTVTGDIYAKRPTVLPTPQGTLYEGVKESVVQLSPDNEGCRVMFSPTATVPDGSVGCYVSVLDTDLPVGMKYDSAQGRLVGTTAQKGAKSVPYAVYYASGKGKTPVQVASGVLPFTIEPTFPPVITGFANQFDKATWLDGKEQLIHKRQANGAFRISLEKRPYDQKVAIDHFGNCVVNEGATDCVAANSDMPSVVGTNEVGGKPFAVDVNSTNSYFVPVVDQVALSWDFRPPQVGDVVQSNLKDPLAQLPTVSGPQEVPFSILATTINSPHNDAKDDWWNPDTITLEMVPDGNTPRQNELIYKGKTLLSVGATSQDKNSTVTAKPVSSWTKTGPQQFRYDFDLSKVKDGDFMATLEVADKYGNSSTSVAKAIRVSRTAPQVGLFMPDLGQATDNDVLFFPERLVVAAHNGYSDDIASVTAKYGPVDMKLVATDTAGVFTMAKADYSSLQAGASYPFTVTATDKAGRTTTKTYQLKYAASDLSFNQTPDNPVQFVQRSIVKVSTTGYDCSLSFDEEQAMQLAAKKGKEVCYAEWKLPNGITPSVNEMGKMTLEGFVEQETGIVDYSFYAISPQGAKMLIKQGQYDMKLRPVEEPIITFNGRRMQGENGFMIDNKGGAVGSVVVSASPGDVNLNIAIPDVLNTASKVAVRKRAKSTMGKISQVIKVPKGEIWKVYPIKVQAKYDRTDKFNVTKEGNIYIVPSKQVKVTMSGLDKETADTGSTEVTSSVGTYDPISKQVKYVASDHGEWNMRLMQELTERSKGKFTRTLVPLTDPVRTDANGQAKLTFDPNKATGRVVTYQMVGDVISPFENFTLQIKSRKQRVSLIKGIELDGTPTINEIVDRVPMKASVRIKPDTDDDKNAIGQAEWQIRDGEEGDWRPAPNATGKLIYNFETEVPGKWQVRAVLHNRMTGVTKPTDITTMVAFAKPEIKLMQESIVMKGQPVKLSVVGEEGLDISDALNVQWSADGVNWEDGGIDNEIIPDPDSTYIYARAEFASTADEAEDRSWVTAKIMPRTLTPQTIRASIDGPSKAEVQKEMVLKGSYKNDYQLVKDVKFVEQWVLPDGSTTDGSTLTYTPTEEGKELDFLYRVWVDGFKDETFKEVKKQVNTWRYTFPRFLTSERQYFKMAPTTIEIRNKSMLPTNAPGVEFTFNVEPTDGVTQTSFKDGKYIADIKAPGIYTLVATLSDNRGNTESKEIMFAVDEAVPMVASITSSYKNKFMRAPLTVTMNSSLELEHPADALQSYSWKLDGEEVKDPLRRQVFPNLPAGDHTIVFDAVSEYGQRASVTHNFTVVPNKPAECKLESTSTTSSVNIKMNCSDPDGKLVAYRWMINGQVVANTSYAVSLTKALQEWPMEVEAIAVDDSGDETTAKITLTGQ